MLNTGDAHGLRGGGGQIARGMTAAGPAPRPVQWWDSVTIRCDLCVYFVCVCSECALYVCFACVYVCVLCVLCVLCAWVGGCEWVDGWAGGSARVCVCVCVCDRVCAVCVCFVFVRTRESVRWPDFEFRVIQHALVFIHRPTRILEYSY